LQDRWHQTPFIMAAGHDWDCFKKLLEMNANINLSTLHGGTAHIMPWVTEISG